jgi:hypothetical protein
VLREKLDLPLIQMLCIRKMLHAQVLALAATKTLQLSRDHARRLTADRGDRAIRNATAISAVTGCAVGKQRSYLSDGRLRRPRYDTQARKQDHQRKTAMQRFFHVTQVTSFA